MKIHGEWFIDNRVIAGAMTERGNRAYCQNAKCNHRYQTFLKSKMVEINEFLFCTKRCAKLLMEQIVEN